MITWFEALVIIFMGLGMFITSMPKRAAIILVIAVLAVDSLINLYGLTWAESIVALIPILTLGEEPQWIKGGMVVLVQSITALILVISSIWCRKQEDRLFFRVMAIFLIASSVIIPLYKYDIIYKFSHYTLIYHTIDITMLLTVFYFSDGTKQLIRSLRDTLSRHYPNSFGFRRERKGMQ